MVSVKAIFFITILFLALSPSLSLPFPNCDFDNLPLPRCKNCDRRMLPGSDLKLMEICSGGRLRIVRILTNGTFVLTKPKIFQEFHTSLKTNLIGKLAQYQDSLHQCHAFQFKFSFLISVVIFPIFQYRFFISLFWRDFWNNSVLFMIFVFFLFGGF